MLPENHRKSWDLELPCRYSEAIRLLRTNLTTSLWQGIQRLLKTPSSKKWRKTKEVVMPKRVAEKDVRDSWQGRVGYFNAKRTLGKG